MAETHAMAIIDDIQSQIYERRTAAACKSINKLCSRKSTPLSCIKVNSIDEVEEKLRQQNANIFLTEQLLHRRSMMVMMLPQLHLIWTFGKSPVLSRLTSFELPCLCPNCLLPPLPIRGQITYRYFRQHF